MTWFGRPIHRSPIDLQRDIEAASDRSDRTRRTQRELENRQHQVARDLHYLEISRKLAQQDHKK